MISINGQGRYRAAAPLIDNLGLAHELVVMRPLTTLFRVNDDQ